jgi:hypothetical protein
LTKTKRFLALKNSFEFLLFLKGISSLTFSLKASSKLVLKGQQIKDLLAFAKAWSSAVIFIYGEVKRQE